MSKPKDKVAVVVQRWHESITGGSENHAWQYARLLSQKYETHLITTTALDAHSWANELPVGEELHEDVLVKRFHIDVGRSTFWEKLYVLLVQRYNILKSQNRLKLPETETKSALPLDELLGWPMALQEEFVRTQGPHSEQLLNYLETSGAGYKAVIFLTYLYSPTCLGMLRVEPKRILFQPTLHDEPPALLPLYAMAAGRAAKIFWNAEEERKLGESLWGPGPGRILPMGIETDLAPTTEAAKTQPYILYSGRIEPGKGCRELFDYFIRYKKAKGGELRLLLTGLLGDKIPSRSDIEFKGFVSEAEKFALMRSAKAFIMPSRLESLSVVTLEAMAQETPVLVNGENPILLDHVEKSGGGFAYTNYEEFESNLEVILSNTKTRQAMGAAGRAYVCGNYELGKVRESLIEEIESLL